MRIFWGLNAACRVGGSDPVILERNEGYKGFNQTGVSDIISRTDPRRVVGA